MPIPISAERWAAARAISEGAPLTQQRLASAMGVHATTLAKKSAEQEWQILDWRSPEIVDAFAELWRRFAWPFAAGGAPPGIEAPEEENSLDEAFAELDAADPGELAVRMVDLAARSAARILVRFEKRGGVLTKGDADALSSIARFSERMEARAAEHRIKQQVRDDIGHAAILATIQERIFCLAGELAERIAAERGGRAANRS